MKKNLFLDLGNVILKVKKEAVIQAISTLLKKDRDDIAGHIDWDLEKAYEKGAISSRQYIEKMNNIFPTTENFTFESLCGLWKKGFEKIDATVDLLPRLGQVNNLYLLSNTNEIHFTAIEQEYKIARYFKKLILSYEVGHRKPGPAIYHKALSMTGATPETSYFVDDLRENVNAARELGITTLHHTTPDLLLPFLKNHHLI